MTTPMELQVLRTLDKHDKLGTAGTVALLQKPASEFGAGLDPVRAGLIGQFLECRGSDNTETHNNMRKWFARAPRVMNRLGLATELDRGGEDGSETALDRLLAMRPNEDQTWTDGGRPANIAWALDDIIDALRAGNVGVGE